MAHIIIVPKIVDNKLCGLDYNIEGFNFMEVEEVLIRGLILLNKQVIKGEKIENPHKPFSYFLIFKPIRSRCNFYNYSGFRTWEDAKNVLYLAYYYNMNQLKEANVDKVLKEMKKIINNKK